MSAARSAGDQPEEAVAADRQLIAVSELAPFHGLAVDANAVEAAVVEDTKRLLVFPDDQRVAPRDARVIEADVGYRAAAEPVPALLQRERDHLVVVLHHQVAARIQGLAQ